LCNKRLDQNTFYRVHAERHFFFVNFWLSNILASYLWLANPYCFGLRLFFLCNLETHQQWTFTLFTRTFNYKKFNSMLWYDKEPNPQNFFVDRAL